MTTRQVRRAKCPGVLFVNTRDSIGADVAVHLLLARHLAATGLPIAFATNQEAHDAAVAREELAREPRLHVLSGRLGQSMSTVHGPARLTAAMDNLLALGTFWRLAWYVRRQRIGLIHTTDRPRDALFATLLGRLTGRPVVIQMHSNYDAGMSRITRWAFAHCDCVLGVSQFTMNSMRSAGVPATRLAAVLNAVDAAHFDPDKTMPGLVRARWDIPPDAPLIGIVGRLIPYKGHEDLLQALLIVHESLPNAHLVIAGADDGAYAGALQSQVKALGLEEKVHFTGHQQDVRPVYADLDLLAVPSWEEPFGLVVTEAMAMRVPVVAYRSGGIPEIVRPGVDGLLVTPRSTRELAAALTRLLGDADLRARMGAAGRRRALDQFTPQRQAAEVAALYRRSTTRERCTETLTVREGMKNREPSISR